MGEGTVLIRRSSLGDVVLLGAVTAVVDKPVTVLTAPQFVEVAARLNGVDHVVSWPKDAHPRGVAASLPDGRWVDLQGSFGSWRIAGFGPRVDKRSFRRRVRLWLGVGAPRPPVVELYAEACGVRPHPAPWITTPELTRDRLVIAPGAAWSTKRWTVDGFREIAARWSGPVTVAGGPGEDEIVRAVAACVGADVVIERGFGATIDAMATARVVLANDSGLMHLGAACGARVVALFGPTHPDDGFFTHRGEVVQRELSCRPCTLHGRERCPIGTHACMQLDVEAVWAAVQRCAG